MGHDAMTTGMTDTASSLLVIVLAHMEVWRGNYRTDLGDLHGLATSIAAHGILEPLIVRPLPVPRGEVTHEVIAGQRRYRAAILAGSDAAPCIVREMDDEEALQVCAVENGQRKDPSPLEEAEALKILLERYGRSVEHVADRLGHDKRYVTRRLALLSLGATARTWLAEGTLPLRHAELLASCDPTTQTLTVDRYKGREVPPYRAFACDVAYSLTVLTNAPFNTLDAKLVESAGSCGKCPKSTLAQPDLFGGVSEDAHCLDRTCWNAKVDANWTKETKAAKRKGLVIIEDVIAYGTTTKRDVPYVSVEELPREHDQSQTAVTRNEFGHIVALYDRPVKAAKKPRSLAAEDLDTDESDGIAPEPDEIESVRERVASSIARSKDGFTRLLATLATPEGLRAGLRTALHAVVTEWGGGDLWRVLDVLEVEYDLDADLAVHVAVVPDAELVRVLVATLAGGLLQDPVDDEAPAFETELRARIEAPPTAPPSPTSATEPPRETTTEPAPTTFPAERVWITAKVWGALADQIVSQLATPDVSADELTWEERDGYRTALVTDATTRDALAHILSVHKIKHEVLFDGEKVSEKKRSKKVKS